MQFECFDTVLWLYVNDVIEDIRNKSVCGVVSRSVPNVYLWSVFLSIGLVDCG